MNMLLHIQKEINLNQFKYVKIPKLVEYDTTDIGIVHIFERVYNIDDIDINNPKLTKFHLTTRKFYKTSCNLYHFINSVCLVV